MRLGAVSCLGPAWSVLAAVLADVGTAGGTATGGVVGATGGGVTTGGGTSPGVGTGAGVVVGAGSTGTGGGAGVGRCRHRSRLGRRSARDAWLHGLATGPSRRPPRRRRASPRTKQHEDDRIDALARRLGLDGGAHDGRWRSAGFADAGAAPCRASAASGQGQSARRAVAAWTSAVTSARARAPAAARRP